MSDRIRIPSTVSPGRFMLIGPAHDQLTDMDRPGEVSVQITDAVNSVACYVPVGALREALGADPRVAELEAEVARLQQEANALRAKVDRQAWSLRRAEEHRRQGDAARAALAALREGVERALTDVEYLLRLQSGKEADYIKGAFAAHDWWRTCLRGPLANLRALLTTTPSVRAAADEHGETGAGL